MFAGPTLKSSIQIETLTTDAGSPFGKVYVLFSHTLIAAVELLLKEAPVLSHRIFASSHRLSDVGQKQANDSTRIYIYVHMLFTSGNGDEKMELEDRIFGAGHGAYKEALLCGELPLCSKLTRRERNLQGWPYTARVEMETWNMFPGVHALLPSYFGMCFLEQEGNLVLGGSCESQ